MVSATSTLPRLTLNSQGHGRWCFGWLSNEHCIYHRWTPLTMTRSVASARSILHLDPTRDTIAAFCGADTVFSVDVSAVFTVAEVLRRTGAQLIHKWGPRGAVLHVWFSSDFRGVPRSRVARRNPLVALRRLSAACQGVRTYKHV